MKPGLRLLAIALLPSLLAASENSPLTGQSLFDQIIGEGEVIPYPFPELLAKIQSRLDLNNQKDSLASILIPRGRSLHREAARPDYYRYPRIVIALDHDGPGSQLVKNRLFLGYQERAASIEVISYNELAGRFEFQVVENYADGKITKARYPNRSLCTSCHQNEAAIFPRPLWRETNFNPEIAGKIGEYHGQYQGIDTSSKHAHADRVDFATDQANLLSAYQLVWQQGCPNDACRATLFLAALLRKLDDGDLADYAWLSTEQDLFASLAQSWSRRWPRGMPVTSGDIEDRISVDGEDSLGINENPLTPRKPLAYWSARTATIRTLEGLADQFLPASDLDRLQHLYVDKTIDQRQIESAVRRLQAGTETARLFRAGPIPGVHLMRDLLANIDTHE